MPCHPAAFGRRTSIRIFSEALRPTNHSPYNIASSKKNTDVVHRSVTAMFSLTTVLSIAMH